MHINPRKEDVTAGAGNNAKGATLTRLGTMGRPRGCARVVEAVSTVNRTLGRARRQTAKRSGPKVTRDAGEAECNGAPRAHARA